MGHDMVAACCCLLCECTPKRKLCMRQAVLAVFILFGCTEVIFSCLWLHYMGLVGSILLLVIAVILGIETCVRQSLLRRRGFRLVKTLGCGRSTRNVLSFITVLLAVYVIIVVFVRLLSFEHIPEGGWPDSCRKL